jgi:PKD repeat protein
MDLMLTGVRAVFRGRWTRGAFLATVVLATLQIGPAGAALPNTSTPALSLDRVIRTSPFTGTTSSVRDNEGSAFVPNVAVHPNKGGTDSLWLADDNGKSLWEINPHTGGLKGRIVQSDLANTKRLGCSSCAAGTNRTVDLESMAYDSATDTLYAFNGKCCSSTVLPTAFRLSRRTDGSFFPESFQPLPSGSNYTAAAWNPGDQRLYVGVGSNLRTYDYLTNASGSTFQVSGVSGILGMTFADGDLIVVNASTKLLRIDWARKAVRAGWNLSLTSFGIRDSRGVEVITNPSTGDDQFYVNDGLDGRSSGDPLNHAVFVLNVCCGSQTAPVASFTSAQVPGTTTMQFTDTSTGSPTSWSWAFGDSNTSTEQNPSHAYTSSGTYSVTLTATNASGSDTVVKSITVAEPTQGSPVTTYGPTADSHIASDEPNRNFGTAPNLHGKLTSTSEKRPYLTFSVGGLQSQAITGAKLRLYVTDPSPSGGDWYTVSPNWIESGTGSITWNNAPPINSAKVGSIGTATTGTWVELDVSSVVTQEGTYSFAMKTLSSNTVYFASKQSTNPPQLMITLAP